MITLLEAAKVMPVDWAVNNLASSILIDHNADPEFNCTDADLSKFQTAAPELGQALVDASGGRCPPVMPDNLSDYEMQALDADVREVALRAFASICASSKANIVELVLAETDL